MKQEEFKKKILEFGNCLVDKCFPNELNIANKIINNTCKYIFKTKASELDGLISMFADKDGDIDILEFVDYMQTNLIGDGMKINFHDYIDKSSALSSIIPDKTLIIKKEDLDAFLS